MHAEMFSRFNTLEKLFSYLFFCNDLAFNLQTIVHTILGTNIFFKSGAL